MKNKLLSYLLALFVGVITSIILVVAIFIGRQYYKCYKEYHSIVYLSDCRNIIERGRPSIFNLNFFYTQTFQREKQIDKHLKDLLSSYKTKPEFQSYISNHSNDEKYLDLAESCIIYIDALEELNRKQRIIPDRSKMSTNNWGEYIRRGVADNHVKRAADKVIELSKKYNIKTQFFPYY